MALVQIPTQLEPPNRRPIHEVLGIPEGAPSPHGSTFWRKLLACPREYGLSQIAKWKIESERQPLIDGFTWHYLLETYYRTHKKTWEDKNLYENPQRVADYEAIWGPLGPRQSFDPMEAAVRALQPLATEPGYTDEYDLMARMLDSYHEQWWRWDRDYMEPVDVECTLELEEGRGTKLPVSGRLDALFIDHSIVGRALRIKEHKSAGRIDSTLLEGYTLDIQILQQQLLALKCLDLSVYPPFLGTVVNISSKAKTPIHIRHTVTADERAIEAMLESLRFWWRILPQMQIHGYPQNLNSCVRKYGRCEYFDVCRSKPNVPLSQLRVRGPHPGFVVKEN